ncbi:MAG: hypothetical protein ACREUU_19240 [Gammaproteobacteria bacterium]
MKESRFWAYYMGNEAETGSAGASDGGGHHGRSPGEQSPLQARAAFIQNWDWQLITSLNRGACERGRALHGINSEAGRTCEAEWEASRPRIFTLGEALDFLKSFHRKAPFLFFNGNTFADIGRRLSMALFSSLPAVRQREVSSAIAHYIAGVLDRESMVELVESLCASRELKAGDRVKTLRGSTRGVILRLLEDGRVVWRPDGSRSELTALPESLLPV